MARFLSSETLWGLAAMMACIQVIILLVNSMDNPYDDDDFD